MTSPLASKVFGIAADVFGVPPANIGADSSPENTSSWDSVNNLNLVLALEEQFQLQFEPEDFERMHTVGGIITVLEQRLG